jgi:hypothetical protein
LYSNAQAWCCAILYAAEKKDFNDSPWITVFLVLGRNGVTVDVWGRLKLDPNTHKSSQEWTALFAPF